MSGLSSSELIPPLVSMVATGLVLTVHGAWRPGHRLRPAVLLLLVAAAHWLALVVSRIDALFTPVTLGAYYVQGSLGIPGLTWYLWLAAAAGISAWAGLLRPPAPWLHLCEILLSLLFFWTALGTLPILYNILFALWTDPEPVLGLVGVAWAETSRLNTMGIGALTGPGAAVLLLATTHFARRAAGAGRRWLTTALLVITLVMAEPCLLLAGAPLVPPSHHPAFWRHPPVWKTAGTLRILQVKPDMPAYVELTDLLSLIRFHTVSGWGGGFRVVTIRTPAGWLPIRWLVMWE